MGQITDLTALTTPASGDLLVVRDVSDATDKDKSLALSKLGVLNLAGTWTAAQSLTQIKAAGAGGLTIEDDGGNVGVDIDDGGVTTIGGTLVVTPVASTVKSASMAGLYQYALIPGSITTAQTWTITITLVNAGANFSAAVDIAALCSSSANPHGTVRVIHRASTTFFRNNSGATATVATTALHVNSNVGVTVTGPTVIADGITYTFAPSAATVNRNVAYLTICSQITPTVTSAVA